MDLENTINEMKNAVESTSIRLDQEEERTCELEHRPFETTQSEEKKEKKNEESLDEVQDNIKQNNLCILAVPKGGERENGTER